MVNLIARIRRIRIPLLMIVLGLGVSTGISGRNQAAAQGQPPMAELDGGTAWLNTEKALSIGDLRGRIVLLDFWTLC
jgi:hypothetical protein